MTKESTNRGAGIIAGIFAAVSFGFIPVFSKPVLAAGVSSTCLLFYRFLFATVMLFALMLMRRESLRIPVKIVPAMLLLAVFYSISGGFLVLGYEYMAGGVTQVIHFTYPIWVMLILVVAYRERIRHSSIVAILLAIVGIYCLGVLGGNASFIPGANKIAGVVIVLLSGLACASYMVGVNKTGAHRLSSLALTFWLILFSTIFFGAISYLNGSLRLLTEPTMVANFTGLAFISTVISNFLLVYSIKNVGSTLAAILGALEPLTSVLACILVFNEPFTLPIAAGIALIITAVIIVILRNR